MYGLSKSEYLSDIFLKTLGIFQLDKIRSAYLDGIIMVDGGPLKGFHLIKPVQADTLSLDDVLNNALLNASSALTTSHLVENVVTQENIGETDNEVPFKLYKMKYQKLLKQLKYMELKILWGQERLHTSKRPWKMHLPWKEEQVIRAAVNVANPVLR